ncbi:hypothetical protein LCGC14_0538800 [marine sediment metagenome]|uniref:Uncharacterized protein n=1 Tax=marine sediment metagenome TaxID=412755 RepID=A0A0F9RTM9_9ZZZZ
MIPKGTALVPARRYKVTHRDNTGKVTKATRIFKWTENRFGSILCFVFTSRVNKDVVASFANDTLTISGRRIPSSELSIPIYDLISET